MADNLYLNAGLSSECLDRLPLFKGKILAIDSLVAREVFGAVDQKLGV